MHKFIIIILLFLSTALVSACESKDESPYYIENPETAFDRASVAVNKYFKNKKGKVEKLRMASSRFDRNLGYLIVSYNLVGEAKISTCVTVDFEGMSVQEKECDKNFM